VPIAIFFPAMFGTLRTGATEDCSAEVRAIGNVLMAFFLSLATTMNSDGLSSLRLRNVTT